ncbi:hypothetical protein LguiB_031560 [Lonicera macranthoides]
MCAVRRARGRARPKCRRAQQLVLELMVDPRTCEAVPVARLGGVGRTRLSLRVYLEMCALTKGGRSCGWMLLSGDIHGQSKGGFMVDCGIGLGGAGPVLVQGGVKVDWFDPSIVTMCADRRARGRARPKCRRAQQLVSELMVDPRTCEAVPVARLGGVGRTRLSLRLSFLLLKPYRLQPSAHRHTNQERKTE